MAIKLSDQYPGLTEGPTTEYPQGSAKNETTPDAFDGTPWEKAIIDDTQGFLQALLAAANITPSGNPDTAVASQYWNALQFLFPQAIPTQRVGLGDNFDAGQYLVCSRFRDTVTITTDNGGSGANEPGALSHAAGTQALSAETIPSEFRPTTMIQKTVWVGESSDESACLVTVRPDGDFFVRYRGTQGVAPGDRLDTLRGFSISYDIVANARP